MSGSNIIFMKNLVYTYICINILNISGLFQYNRFPILVKMGKLNLSGKKLGNLNLILVNIFVSLSGNSLMKL